MIEVVQGDVRSVANMRTTSKAMDRLIDLIMAWGPIEKLAIIQANNPPLRDELEGRLSALFALDGCIRSDAGPTVVTHVGPGAVAVAGILRSDQS